MSVPTYGGGVTDGLTDRFLAFVREMYAAGHSSHEIACVLSAPGYYGYDALPFLQRPSSRIEVVSDWLERTRNPTAIAPVVSQNTGEYPATPASNAT